MNRTTIWLALLLTVGCCAVGRAEYRSLVGYADLQAYTTLHSLAMPTGVGIQVAIVEADLRSANQSDPTHVNYLSYPLFIPNPSNAEFNSAAKNWLLYYPALDSTPPIQNQNSSHALTVGVNFVGKDTSIAPGVTDIQVWNANHWIQEMPAAPSGPPALNGFLRVNSTQIPGTSAARVANHSYIGVVGLSASQFDFALRRIDLLAQRDDFIQVAGLPNTGNSNSPWWKDSYNAIVVGVTSRAHISGTVLNSSVYKSGRVAPTLVAPGYVVSGSGTATSYATPMVSAAAALLLQIGQDQPSLSNGSYTNGTRTIRHAESSEVVKAVLMTGADRVADSRANGNNNSWIPDTGSLAYATVGNASLAAQLGDNNLDRRYGAGQLNIFNSYRILTAGEQDAGPINFLGWDYNDDFDSAEVVTYSFTADNDGTLFASLVWNLTISDTNLPQINYVGDMSGYNSGLILHDLDLLLYDVTEGEEIYWSLSDIDNTENIYFDGLLANHDYEMRVFAKDGQNAFTWDYALAWRVELVPEPASGSFIFLAFAALALVRRKHVR